MKKSGKLTLYSVICFSLHIKIYQQEKSYKNAQSGHCTPHNLDENQILSKTNKLLKFYLFLYSTYKLSGKFIISGYF